MNKIFVLDQDGFSLIEIVITLVVLSIAVIGVLSVFTAGMRGSANPMLIDQAEQLAQDRMEMIVGDRINYGFSHIIPGYYGNDSVLGFGRSVSIFCVSAADLNTSLGAPGAGGCASGYTHVTVTVSNAAIGSVTVDGLVTNY